MSSMANWRGLLVISLFLAALQLFLTEPAYCIGRTSERHGIRSTNWEKNSTELKGSSSRKLKGIPANSGNARVITVDAKKGQGDFTTVQDAIDAVPANNKNPVTINVKPGIYREKVTISEDKPFITLRGSDAKSTVITWNASGKSSGGTYYSGTVSVLTSDFIAKDITIENSYDPSDESPDDQAVAVRISGDRCAFYNCRFLGYQDTVLDESGKHYFENCYIEGAIDIICGNGKSLYKKCEIHAIPKQNGAFTAQKRSSPSEDSGFVFLQCKLTGNGLMYLGRPWGPYSTVVFANTAMDDIIFPEGWSDWNGQTERRSTVNYSEFQCSGPGAAQQQRVSWSNKVSTSANVAPYLSLNYIDGSSWIE